MTAAVLAFAFIALAVIAVVGWCVAYEWAEVAADTKATAKRAEDFAEECLAENRDLRERAEGREEVLRMWRAWAGRLERHIHDTREYEAAVTAERESVRLDGELFELLNEEGS